MDGLWYIAHWTFIYPWSDGWYIAHWTFIYPWSDGWSMVYSTLDIHLPME